MKKILGIALVGVGIASLFSRKVAAVKALDFTIGLPKDIRKQGIGLNSFVSWSQPVVFENPNMEPINVQRIELAFYAADTQTLVGTARAENSFQIPFGGSIARLACTAPFQGAISTVLAVTTVNNFPSRIGFDVVGQIVAENIAFPVNERIFMDLTPLI